MSVQAMMTPGEITMAAYERAQTSLMGGITALRDCGGKDYLELAVRDACNRRSADRIKAFFVPARSSA